MGCIYSKLISEFEGDITKKDALTSVDVDENFYFLRGSDIQKIDINENKTILTLTFVNGNEISVELSKDNSEIISNLDTLSNAIDKQGSDMSDLQEKVSQLLSYFDCDINGKLIFNDYVFENIFELIVENEQILPEYRYEKTDYGFVQNDNGEYKKVEWHSRWVNDAKTVNEAILKLDWGLSKVEGEYAEEILNIKNSLNYLAGIDEIDDIKNLLEEKLNTETNNRREDINKVITMISGETVAREFAISNAIEISTSKATAAKEEAIAVASTDATAKANAAISIAIDNAITKANAAQAAAEANAAADATAKFETCKLYTDNKITEITNAFKLDDINLKDELHGDLDNLRNTIEYVKDTITETQNSFSADLLKVNENINIFKNDINNKLIQLNQDILNIKEDIKHIETKIDTKIEEVLKIVNNKLDSKLNELDSKINRITEVGGVLDTYRETIMSDAKKEFISTENFVGVDNEIKVTQLDGKLQIGFSESLLLGI